MPDEFRDDPTLFTGEHVFPWSLTEDEPSCAAGARRPTSSRRTTGRGCTTRRRCAPATYRAAAAIYAEDAYVDRALSEETAALVPHDASPGSPTSTSTTACAPTARASSTGCSGWRRAGCEPGRGAGPGRRALPRLRRAGPRLAACFTDWALGVADDAEVLRPGRHAARPPSGSPTWSSPPPAGTARRPRSLRRAAARCCSTDWDAVRATVLARATQTNEVGRCATLLPVLAALPRAARAAGGRRVGRAVPLPGPLLLPLHRRRHRPRSGRRAEPGRARLRRRRDRRRCRAGLPEVVWRGGIDLNPLDVRDDDAMRWLETLVWPEHDDRRARLAAAVGLAREDPPTLVRGDLYEALPGPGRHSARRTRRWWCSTGRAGLPRRRTTGAGSRRWSATARPLGEQRGPAGAARPRARRAAGSAVGPAPFVLGLDGRAGRVDPGPRAGVSWSGSAHDRQPMPTAQAPRAGPRARRRPDRRRRAVRHRRRLPPRGAAARARRTPCSRRATRSAAPGTCSATPGCAPTPTCSRSATGSGRGPTSRRSPTAPAILDYVRETAREHGVERARSATATASCGRRWSSDDATLDGRRPSRGRRAGHVDRAASCGAAAATTATTRATSPSFAGVEDFAAAGGPWCTRSTGPTTSTTPASGSS